MLKAYKFRIYPNKKQEEQIIKTFGCVRFVYNAVLEYRESMYKTQGKTLSKFESNNYCTRVLKPKYNWLREVDAFALINSVFNLDSAFKKYFKEHTGYPKFKSKHNMVKSYTTNLVKENIEIDFDNNKIKLPKLQLIKARVHRKVKGQIKSATVSKVPSGKYFVSVLVETEHKELPHTENKVGVDLGIKSLCAFSDGRKYKNPKALSKYEKKLARLQQGLALKTRGSNNYYKQKKRVALCHEKIANIRKDYLHKLSYEIIKENQIIVSETLQVKDMLKDSDMAKYISDASWYELTRQLQYKAEWNGRQYIQIDTYYPSSQLCSVCSYKNPKLKDLSIRKWECPVCHSYHDRDINAAINILNEGLKQIA